LGERFSVVNWIWNSQSHLTREGCHEKESKCRLVIDVDHNHVVLNGNKLTRDRYPVCDCLIFVEGPQLNVTVAECKKRMRDAGRALKQLSNGWLEARKILAECATRPSRLKCYAVILTNNWNRTADQKKAQKATIQMEGKRQVRLGNCGASLSSLVPDL